MNKVIDLGSFSKFAVNRRVVDKGGLSPTLIAGMDRSDNVPMVVETIKIRVANKTGYQELDKGGVFDYNQQTSQTRRGRVIDRGKVSGTIMATEDKAVYEGGRYRIRKLTPRECWRLMDFDDADFDKAQAENSNTQLYKQAGNSIVKSVIKSIIKEML